MTIGDQEKAAAAAMDDLEQQPTRTDTGTTADIETKHPNDLQEAPVLDPPLTSAEIMRDALLRKLDGTCFQYIGIAVLFLIVASGAIFFFFLMGWQTLCRPRVDCQPRNTIYNISIQILTGLFTYLATFSMPWRCTNFLHTVGWSCPKRENSPGHDLYGQETNDVWFHVSLRKRTWILLFLLLNCLTQYANQITRIIFWSYELQYDRPGSFWVNIFFVSSMLSAFVAAVLLGYYTGQIRATDPDRFGAGPIELIQEMWYKIRHRQDDDQPAVAETEAEAAEDGAAAGGGGGVTSPEDNEGGSGTPGTGTDADGVAAAPTTVSPPPHHHHHHRHPRASEVVASEFDPTRARTRRTVIDVDRSSMRMFGL